MSKVIGGNTGSGRPKVISGGTGNGGSSNHNQSSNSSNNSSSSNNSDCFVATAAFGTPLQPEIQVLRNWRDDTLRYTSFGRKFISNYYKFGPILANFIHKYPVFKVPVRTVVKLIIRLMK